RSSLPIEINAGRDSHAVTFSANGEHLLSGGRYPNIGVWRKRDSQQVATIEAQNVLCLAVSKDGSWIAAGTYWGDVFVWDSETHERVLEHKQGYRTIRAIDFSPDSTKLVWASEDATATIWDVNTHQRVKILRHEGPVIAAKFSPRGDGIATATQYSVRVWNSNFDNVHIPIRVTPCYNNGLAWSNDHLYAVSGSNIKQLDPSTGSTLSEWSIPGSSDHSCIALLEHGKFMAYSTNRTLMFWDMSTHAQLPSTEHHGNINSIALSPGDRLIAICGEDGRVVFKSLPRITNSFTPPCLHPTLQEPDIQIDQSVLNAWKNNRLEDAEASLTSAINQHQRPSHHLLAARALIRARLEHWDEALVDASKAIDGQPSMIAYIAKSIAHVGKGKKEAAYRTCDIAFEHFHSSHVTLLLLVKAIIVFMAREYPDATSRMDDLIATVQSDPTCSTVQAYMYHLLGSMHMDRKAYQHAIQSFECARAHLRHYQNRMPLVVSLMSGWKFDDLHIAVRQRLCEALYAAGRTKDSSEALLDMLNTFDEEIYMSAPITQWVSEFKHLCVERLESSGDTAMNAEQHDNAISCYYAALELDPAAPQRLRIKRSRAYVAIGLWKEALRDANEVGSVGSPRLVPANS
ncbi:WD40-repeat-containing domain protein, partial [Tylopilus felleus]